MPGDSGGPVATTLVCFIFCTRGYGCGGHPALPAPSFEGRATPSGQRVFPINSGASRRENVELWLQVASLRAKRSNPSYREKEGLRRRFVPRKDGLAV